jgi:MoaA/NifB/PqqE/SkfB family radical SAM enzyme
MQPLQKKLDFPKVDVKFPGRFPAGHVNDVRGWNFPQSVLTEAARDGRMLSMDLDMTGSASCSLRCKFCFNPTVRLMQRRNELLSDAQVLRVVEEGKSLGLRSIKIIGPGEPLEDPTLLHFLDFLAKRDITPLIFTKATALGDERLSKAVHGISPHELALRLRDDFSATILFGANSFHPETQADIVGVAGYPAVRNRAMELLASVGFNDFTPDEPTRLSLIVNPILRSNIDEISDMHVWARRRNIYIISSPTMISGECRESSAYNALTPSEAELLSLYVKINTWAIQNGIYSLSDIEREGVSPYVGVRPCQQVGHGMFVRRDGLVLRCPGDDVSIQGSLKTQSLAEIWAPSENLRRFGGMMNVGCPPKLGKTIPLGFFDKVLEGIRGALGQGDGSDCGSAGAG